MGKPNPRAATIITQFKSLPRQLRREVYNSIMDELEPHEWRDVKARARITTFQFDILGNVPLEIAALISGHLDAVDVIRLQTVSRTWQKVLTSIPVYTAIIRATMGQAALDSTPDVVDDQYQHMLLSLIRRKLRVESAKPKSSVFTRGSQNWPHFHISQKQTFGYCDRALAWVDLSERSCLRWFNLQNRQETHFTTRNRELLGEVRMSNFLVAALSIRYCHVWDLTSSEHSSFRIPSQMHFNATDRDNYRSDDQFVVNGLNVVLFCGKHAIHWNLIEKIARTVPIGAEVLLLAVHPSESQFTTVRRCTSRVEIGSSTKTSPDEGLHLVIDRFTVNDTKDFQSTRVCEQFVDGITSVRGPCLWVEVHCGQSTRLTAGKNHRTSENFRLFLSLNPDGSVVANCLSSLELDFGSIACVVHGVLYAVTPAQEIVVLTCRVTGSCPEFCEWRVHKFIREEEIHARAQWLFVDNTRETSVAVVHRTASGPCMTRLVFD